MFDKVSERVQESSSPRVPTTGRIGGFGNPEWLAGLESVSEVGVECPNLFRSREPVLRECRCRRCLG
jgi:hypothetical protein